MKDTLIKQMMNALTQDGTPVSMIQCNNCDLVSAWQPTDVTAEQLEKHGKETIMRMKEHFKEAGWQTSWGYDLCLECAQEHGKATPSKP